MLISTCPRSTGRKSKRSLTCHVTITPSMGLRTSRSVFLCSYNLCCCSRLSISRLNCAARPAMRFFSSLESPLSSSNDRRVATSCSSLDAFLPSTSVIATSRSVFRSCARSSPSFTSEPCFKLGSSCSTTPSMSAKTSLRCTGSRVPFPSSRRSTRISAKAAMKAIKPTRARTVLGRFRAVVRTFDLLRRLVSQ